MPDYLLSTAKEVWREDDARDAYEAVKRAVSDSRFSRMGHVISCKPIIHGKVKRSPTEYVSSIRVLKELGLWSE